MLWDIYLYNPDTKQTTVHPLEVKDATSSADTRSAFAAATKKWGFPEARMLAVPHWDIGIQNIQPSF